MLTKRFEPFAGLRAMIGVAVLSLVLVVAVVGTTEPAAALDSDPNQAEMLCGMVDGQVSYRFIDRSVYGYDIWRTYCHYNLYGVDYVYTCAANTNGFTVCVFL